MTPSLLGGNIVGPARTSGLARQTTKVSLSQQKTECRMTRVRQGGFPQSQENRFVLERGMPLFESGPFFGCRPGRGTVCRNGRPKADAAAVAYTQTPSAYRTQPSRLFAFGFDECVV